MISLFATPLWVERVDLALCATTAAALVDESARTPSLERSVVGWHGPPDLPRREGEPWGSLTEAVAGAVLRAHGAQVAAIEGEAPEPGELTVSLEGWGTVLRRGDHVVPHDHAGALWSAVCYLDAGDAAPGGPADAGALVLVDPRGTAATPDLFPRHCTVTPETGLLVVFPAWLSHFVPPYTGSRPRVSAAYNAQLSPS